MKKGLSVTVITLNEERNIRRCLESVRDIADEMVVVDSGSSDGTGDICRELGARFLFNEWPGHKEQKNFALEKAEHEWILSLDADEWIDGELAAEIRTVVDGDGGSGNRADAYEVNRRTMFLGRFVDVWSPDWIFRFFRKGCGRFQGTNPHDFFRPGPEFVTGRMKGRINHESYVTLEQYFARLNSYTTIAARAEHERGKRFSAGKMIFSPLWHFFKKVVVKRAPMDGYRGLIIAVTSAYYVFLKYAKLWELETTNASSSGTPVLSSEHKSRSA